MRRLLWITLSLCVLFLAGCEREYTGVLVGYDEVNLEDDIYLLKFEDGTEWKVVYEDAFFPLGKKVRIKTMDQSGKPGKVMDCEVLRSSGPVEPVDISHERKKER